MHEHALTVVPHHLHRAAETTLQAPEQCKSTVSGHALHVQARHGWSWRSRGPPSPRPPGVVLTGYTIQLGDTLLEEKCSNEEL